MNYEETHEWFAAMLTSFDIITNELTSDPETRAGALDASALLRGHATALRGMDEAGQLTGNGLLVELSGYLNGASMAVMQMAGRDRIGSVYALGYVELCQKVEQAIAYIAGVIV